MGIISSLLGGKDPYNNWPKSYDSYRSDMAKAAGVGVARVRCHRNTWAYLEESVPRDIESTIIGPDRGPGTAFRPPAEDEISSDQDGMVTVPLSGTTLAAVLSWCRNVQPDPVNSPWTAVDRSIARRVGSAISQALLNVVPSNGQDGPTAVIYLDDRITARDSAA
ncbi:hypothetical protein [Streptomyces sp. NPDC060366]|uniref:hypothetical protein n=1 Tax=Streptomyces sp. NPDC060366 TaxID=3347105 RepID=UPI00366964D9